MNGQWSVSQSGVLVPCDVEGVAKAGTLVAANDAPEGPFVIGFGDNFAGIEAGTIFYDTPMKMATLWMNGSADLSFLLGYGQTVSEYYANGYAIEFVVWLADEPDYATSTTLVTDLTSMEAVLRGPADGPPLFVVLFTEWETYAGTSTTYAEDLKTQYITLANMFRANNPNAYIGLGNGGYDWSGQTTVDLTTGYAAVNAASDMGCVQQMQADGNTNGPNRQNEIIPNTRNAVRDLGSQLGKPVMISHMLTWETTEAEVSVLNAWETIRDDLFADASVEQLREWGLFAIGFQNGGAADYFLNYNVGYPTTVRKLSKLATRIPMFPVGRGVRFSADGQDYSSTSSPPTGSYTITCWAKISVDRNAISTVWSAGSSSTVHHLLQTAADGTTLNLVANNGAATLTGPNMTVDTWYKLAVVVNGATATLFYGTEGTGLTTVSAGGWPVASGYTSLQIGESIINAQWLNGCVANFKHFNTALSASEVADELTAFEPQHKAALVRWHPFRGHNLPADVSGNNRVLSGGSGVGVQPGPATIRWSGFAGSAATGGPGGGSGGGGTAVFRSSSSNAAFPSTSFTVNTPTGTATGDLLVAVHIADDGGDLTSMTASGWTLAGSYASTGYAFLKVWTQRVTGTPPTNFTFGGSAGAGAQVAILAFTGASTTLAVAPVVTDQPTASTAHILPAAAAVTGNVQVGAAIVNWKGTGAAVSWTVGSSGMTERVDVNDGYFSLWTGTQTGPTSGTKTITASRSIDYITCSFVVAAA